MAPRGCQAFPEYSYEWLEAEFDTIATRTPIPSTFQRKRRSSWHEVHKYWKGKTTSELALLPIWQPETLLRPIEA